MIARTVFIEGHVQGVFFREWTVSQAREVGVTGWVRNRRDGRVEVFVEGEAAPVDRFIERLHQGPPASEVTSISVETAEITRIAGFTRRQTA